MSRTVAAAELAAFKPGDSEPFVTVPGTDLQSVEISERIQDAMDSGSVSVTNHDATYTGAQRITSGDRLVFRAQLADDDGLHDYWTAMARNVTDVLRGGTRQRLDIEATDFVFTVLSWRLAYETFDDVPIAGSEDAILNTLLDEAPEVGRDQIADITQQTGGFYNGRDLLSIVTEDLAPIADAVVAQDGTSLVFQPLGDLTTQHAIAPQDFRADINVTRSDDTLANLVRVDGGTDNDSDASQETHSSTERVTGSDRLSVQVETRKSEIDRVEVWTQLDPDSSDGITLRLQADRNGSPVAPGDTTSDTVSKTLAPEFISDGGWTTFILPAHTLPPESYPWLLIEADGSDGQLIGVDGSGVPAYRAMYPFPLLTRVPDAASQTEYRRRDHRIKDESIGSFAAVRDKARSYLRHHNTPEVTVSGAADSIRAHQLAPGQAVDLSGWSRTDLEGAAICREREIVFDGAQMSTTLTLQEPTSL